MKNKQNKVQCCRIGYKQPQLENAKEIKTNHDAGILSKIKTGIFGKGN